MLKKDLRGIILMRKQTEIVPVIPCGPCKHNNNIYSLNEAFTGESVCQT